LNDILALEISSENAISILDEFAEIDDPRLTTNRKHLLGDIITISIMAVIAGADGPVAIETWATDNREWVEENLEVPNGIPSHDTIGRLLAALKPEPFQNCFLSWINRVAPDQSTAVEQIAIDGKVLKGSHDRINGFGPLWLVSAWSVDRGISLGQLATDEKSNEITAIPTLLDSLELESTVITIDAAGTQKNIAKQIVDGGGDYVLALKGNQKTIFEDAKTYIEQQMENDFADVKARKFQQAIKGHGRTEELTYYQMNAPEELTTRNEWAGLRTIGIAIRISETSGKITTEVRYYISSLRLSVKKFASYIRGHWAIENTLHWSLDVTFKEDASRIRNRNLATNMAWLRRFALSCLKQMDDKKSVAMRRRSAAWNINYAAKVLGFTPKSVR